MGPTGVISLVEADGFMVDGHIASLALRGQLRGLRDGATGQPIFVNTMQDSDALCLGRCADLLPDRWLYRRGDRAAL